MYLTPTLAIWISLSAIGVTINTLLLLWSLRGARFAHRVGGWTLKLQSHNSLTRSLMREVLHLCFGSLGVIGVLTPPATHPGPLNWHGLAVLAGAFLAQCLFVGDAVVDTIYRYRILRHIEREDPDRVGPSDQ